MGEAGANRQEGGVQQRVTLSVDGMSCGGCVDRVEGKLRSTPGVEGAQVDLGRGLAEVTYDPSRTEPERLVAALSSAGYEAAVLAG